MRLLSVVLFFTSIPLVAQQSPAWNRLATLQRGTNLSGWLGGSSDLSADHFATHTTPADLKLIHDSGLQYVRLGVEPTQITKGGYHSAESKAALARVDQAVQEILDAGLAVQITVFPNSEYKQQLNTQHGVDQFLFLWHFLAEHFKPLDPERVFLELLNEPEMTDPYRWMGVQASAIQTIRAVDTTHTIIATSARYSGLNDTLELKPDRDPNVIYTFHFYEPYPFTHQGAPWGSPEWNYFHDIPYPASAADLKTAMAATPDESARYVLFLYGSAGWNRASMFARMQFVRDWADHYHVPVICNEFGAFRDTAPPDSRVRYLTDVRTNLEQLHIGWAMWDYRGNFGMVTHEDGAPHPDPAVFKALGLATPK